MLCPNCQSACENRQSDCQEARETFPPSGEPLPEPSAQPADACQSPDAAGASCAEPKIRKPRRPLFRRLFRRSRDDEFDAIIQEFTKPLHPDAPPFQEPAQTDSPAGAGTCSLEDEDDFTGLEDSLPRYRRIHWASLLSTVLTAAVCVFLIVSVCMLNHHTNKLRKPQPWFDVRRDAVTFDAAYYRGRPDVTLPAVVNGKQVRSLGPDAFRGCVGLTTVYLPDTLERIGSGAFADCSSMRGLFIPQSVTQIGSEAFSGCSALEAICIPASVTEIGSQAFEDCPNLHFIFYDGNLRDWQELYGEFVNFNAFVICKDGNFRYEQPHS